MKAQYINIRQLSSAYQEISFLIFIYKIVPQVIIEELLYARLCTCY